MNMEAIIDMVMPIWLYVRNTVYGWFVIIAVILMFLLIFKCYRSPLSIAMDKLRKLHPVLVRLSSRKSVPSRKRIRHIHVLLVRCGRFVQAYLYDHPSEAAVSDACRLISSADRAILALSLDSLQKNAQASKKVIRNAASLVSKAIDSIAR